MLERDMVALQVSDVERANAPKDAIDRERALAEALRRPIVATYRSDAKLVACDGRNQLALAVHDAFFEHRPLVLSPDSIWFCIATGFANHMALHAETLRARFVSHEGRAPLIVTRADFAGGRDDPWPEAFAAFSEQIAAHVGKARDLIVCDFSTTGPLERAASEVLLMDTFQAYFSYVILMGCGIPEIHLRGSVDDWRSVRARARMLGEYGLEGWVDVLDPVLEQFERAARGDVDRSFWRSLFRYDEISGGNALNGWIQTLFPYLQDRWGDLRKNKTMKRWSQRFRAAEQERSLDWQGPDLNVLPPSLGSVPVRMVDMSTGETHELRFVAGLFGVVEEPDGALAPEFGWAVVHDVPAGQ